MVTLAGNDKKAFELHEILTDFTPHSLTAANKANLFKFVEYLGTSAAPKAELHDDAEFTWSFTGIDHPYMNNVLRARLTPHNAE